MTTDLDDHIKAIIFTKGLVPNLQKSVLQQHPETLQNALRAARCAKEVAKLDDSPNSNAPMFAAVSDVVALATSHATAKAQTPTASEFGGATTGAAFSTYRYWPVVFDRNRPQQRSSACHCCSQQ